MNEPLHIELHYRDPTYSTYLVSGLTPKEMDSVIDALSFEEQRDTLVKLLNSHDNDLKHGKNIGTVWMCGYGIYDIRHFGGHLLVKVGNSCD